MTLKLGPAFEAAVERRLRIVGGRAGGIQVAAVVVAMRLGSLLMCVPVVVLVKVGVEADGRDDGTGEPRHGGSDRLRGPRSVIWELERVVD